MKKVSVQCHNIRAAYGTIEVLKNVNLDIKPGEFLHYLDRRVLEKVLYFA